MPPAIIAAVVAAGAGAINQNLQNKAAIKNNEVQQAASVANAQQVSQRAQQQMAPWLQQGASPFANFSVTQPSPYGQPQQQTASVRGGPQPGMTGGMGMAPYQPHNINIASLLSNYGGAGAQGVGAQDPHIAALLQQMGVGQNGQPGQSGMGGDPNAMRSVQ